MRSEPDLLAIVICGLVVALTLVVTFAAARRSRTDSEFLAAGRRVRSWQNGLAIAGEFISAGSFLGTTGLIFFYGVDGGIILAASVVSFLPVLFLLAERMRNVGRYTLADVLAFRTRERPVRFVAALSTVATGGFVLMAQLVAAGVLLESLSGIPFAVSVLVTGVLMAVYVFVGGMLATTWVQVIKSALLCVIGLAIGIAVLKANSFSVAEIVGRARDLSGEDIARPGLLFGEKGPLNLLSYGLTFALGTAGMAHILIRFFTVPDAQTARRSIGWTVGVVSGFYLVVILMGFGAVAILGENGADLVGVGGNLAAPALVTVLGGGVGTQGGSIALAAVAAVAFASIVAVVAGVVISGAGSLAHDVWPHLRRPGSTVGEASVARVCAVAISVLAIAGTIAIGDSTNITFLMGMAFMVAASSHLPSLVLSMTWRGFNTTGAVTGILTGLVSTVVLLMLTPALWPGDGPAPMTLDLPVVITLPLGVLGCVLGSLVGRRSEAVDDERFAQLVVRAETGVGAEAVG
jgi:cation/acetate symporter